MSDPTTLAALKMLARRELSEAQIRQRLARLGHARPAIDDAVAALKANGSIDDARVAGAIARTEATFKRRGRLRVRQRLAATGIATDVADRALDEVFEEVDAEALLEAALERRLAGRTAIADDREMARLFRQLTGQGFERDRVLRVLRARRAGTTPEPE